MQGKFFYHTKPSLTQGYASGDWTCICRGESSVGPGEEMTRETLHCREKNRRVWSHADWIGIPFWSLGCATLGSNLASLKLSFLIYKRGQCYGISGLEICDSKSPTCLAQGLRAKVDVFSRGAEQSTRRSRHEGL